MDTFQSSSNFTEEQQSPWMEQRSADSPSEPAWMRNQSSSEKKFSFPPMTVENAEKIISGFSSRPDWFANPGTSHAANAVYQMASDVLSKHIQLERLNKNVALTATENRLGYEMAQKLSELPGAVAAKYYAKDENGNRPIDSLESFGDIQKDWDTYVLPKKEAAAKAKSGGTTSATPGSVIYDKATGKILETVPLTEYQTVTEKFPAKAAVEPTPEQKVGIYGFRKTIPATPGSPYQPERTVTTRKAVSQDEATPESEILQFPNSKEEAVKGKRYQTRYGPMTWDGNQFVP